MSKLLHITFGALCKKLKEQFKEQGFNYPKGRDYFQQYADSLCLLSVGNILSPSEVHKARTRLLNIISKAVNEL